MLQQSRAVIWAPGRDSRACTLERGVAEAVTRVSADRVTCSLVNEKAAAVTRECEV